ncbi:hypothetical protein [Acinetobacter brisouii]|uniref:hypothetical protein n=1 Tax=Acinetobacter brisouii TaxID=396323 RepID=UPI00124D5722|nr:hypothetical protein [Acinetobacter brisouii]
MSKLFVLNDPAVRELRESHPLLKNKALIGTGQFSGVFEGSRPDTVYKLSIDRASYIFHTSYLGKSDRTHFTKVIQDHGIVGRFKTSKNVVRTKLSNPRELDAPIYLYEVEKLHKIPVKTENKLLSMRITKDWRTFDFASDQQELFHRALDVSTQIQERPYMQGQDSVLEALLSISYFLGEYSDAFVDIHGANMMQRANGDFVFSDPIGDLFIYNSHYTFGSVNEITPEMFESIKSSLIG